MDLKGYLEQEQLCDHKLTEEEFDKWLYVLSRYDHWFWDEQS